jgi:hypothetical protein
MAAAGFYGLILFLLSTRTLTIFDQSADCLIAVAREPRQRSNRRLVRGSLPVRRLLQNTSPGCSGQSQQPSESNPFLTA